MNQLLSFFRRAGKERSFEERLAPHLNALFKMAYQYCGNQPDAEDLVQELLVDLYANQHKMEGIENLKSWLLRCLYNKFVDQYRRQRPMANAADCNDPALAEEFSYQPNHESDLLHQKVLQGLETLPPKQRTVVIMHDMNGYSLPELEKILDIPLGTLKSDLHRAREKLKEKIILQPLDESIRHSR